MGFQWMILAAVAIVFLGCPVAGQNDLRSILQNNYQCSTVSCGENESYRSCGLCYQQFCNQDFYVNCPNRCYCGCYCRSGYIRDAPIDGRCILQAGCPSFTLDAKVRVIDFGKIGI
uniref:TIL domain-containing protein n=1 Tax=Anopheles atroparvus TaxID=41427 RepID=A0AAG5CSX5_ANOAO